MYLIQDLQHPLHFVFTDNVENVVYVPCPDFREHAFGMYVDHSASCPWICFSNRGTGNSHCHPSVPFVELISKCHAALYRAYPCKLNEHLCFLFPSQGAYIRFPFKTRWRDKGKKSSRELSLSKAQVNKSVSNCTPTRQYWDSGC